MKTIRGKILVCDDQKMLRRLLVTAISSKAPDLEIFEACNGQQAEMLIRENDFKLVFLDVDMPEQDGFATLTKIREESLVPRASIVMCTGRASEEDVIRGWHLDADFYLTKPFDIDQLEEIMDELTEHHGAAA